MTTRHHLHTGHAVIAAVILSYAARLSSGDRHLVDWVVISAVSAAGLWSLFQAGRRLHGFEGARGAWHLQRTLLFWVVGLLNTAFVRPEQADSFRPWVGGAFIAVAVVDTIRLMAKERRAIDALAAAAAAEAA